MKKCSLCLLLFFYSMQGQASSSLTRRILNRSILVPQIFYSNHVKSAAKYSNLLIPWAANQRDPVLEELEIIKGKGSEFYITNGHGVNHIKILDMGTAYGVYNFGFAPDFLEKLRRGLASDYESEYADGSVEHLQSELGHPLRDLYSQKLIDYSPFRKSGGRALFTIGGGHANAAFRKIAIQYQKSKGFENRNIFIAQTPSYHGGSGALDSELSGCTRRTGFEDFYAGKVIHAEHLSKMRDDENSIVSLIEELGPDRVAAVSFEFVMGTSGVLLMSEEKVNETVLYLKKHGILVHADEVIAGWGRTGKRWAHDHFPDVEIDFMTIAKATTAGYGTLSAVLMSEEIAGMYDTEPLMVGLTYFAGLRDLRIATAVLDHMDTYEDEILARVNHLGENLASEIYSQLGGQSYFVEYRHQGLMGAIELKNPITQEPFTQAELVQLRRKLLDRGVYFFGRNQNLILMPSFVLSIGDIRYAISTLKEELDKTFL